MRSINEELNIIADLENQGYSQRTIKEVLTEKLETSQGFDKMEDLLNSLDNEYDSTDGTPDDECDEEGCPVL